VRDQVGPDIVVVPQEFFDRRSKDIGKGKGNSGGPEKGKGRSLQIGIELFIFWGETVKWQKKLYDTYFQKATCGGREY